MYWVRWDAFRWTWGIEPLYLSRLSGSSGTSASTACSVIIVFEKQHPCAISHCFEYTPRRQPCFYLLFCFFIWVYVLSRLRSLQKFRNKSFTTHGNRSFVFISTYVLMHAPCGRVFCIHPTISLELDLRMVCGDLTHQSRRWSSRWPPPVNAPSCGKHRCRLEKPKKVTLHKAVSFILVLVWIATSAS